MLSSFKSSFWINLLISFVWFSNGLFCKVLNLVPRHQEIVARILGAENAFVFTKIIGVLEIIMGFWVLSNYKSKWNALVQIVVVLTMNILEFILVPDLLLWGRFNIVFALIFVYFVYYNAFKIKE